MTTDALRVTLANARDALLAHRRENGAFTGELTSSALSTATAAIAFALAGDDELAGRGRAWLAANQNEDGGWGDTVDSPSNISTTVLGWIALGFAEADEAAARAEEHIAAACGSLAPADLVRTIRARYGKDKTFSVPILMTCALGGKLGWSEVPSLPFELAAFPHRLFQWLRLPMVSYALPALIAIGQVRHHHRPTWNPITRLARVATRAKTLRLLERIQPSSGGYLEAAPLTSFVSMALLSMGLGDHPVTVSALRFLRDGVRADGSWPIDTNLDTWTTTLAINALGDGDAATCRWIEEQQYTEVHPYTHAEPGGWAWTDLPGGVPDADDTSGAVLALHVLGGDPDRARAGLSWLEGVQNRDGGIPTFCRGWTNLPFDRSSPDITAHYLRAARAWTADGPGVARAVRYLLGAQRADGAWVPLWFGNQAEPAQENPLYGTSRVVLAIAEVGVGGDLDADWRAAAERAVAWLGTCRHESGGYGGAPGLAPTIEETALALEALAAWGDDDPGAVAWLAEHTARGTRFSTAPIGLYFAKLWYAEKLYPLIFTVAALEAVGKLETARTT